MNKLVVQGILWMLIFNLVDAIWINIGSYIAQGVNTFQIICYSNGTAAILLFSYLKFKGSFKVSENLKLHFARVGIELVGGFLYLYSLALLSVTNVKSLIFLVPIFASFHAIFFLKEKSSPYIWSVLAISFVGVLIILQPDKGVINPASFMVIGGALFLSGGLTILKVLSTREDPKIVACHFMGLTSFAALPLAIYYGKPLNNELIIGIGSIGLCFLILQVSLGKACEALPLVMVTPFMFIGLIFVALLAYILVGEVPQINSFIGGAIILVAATYSGYRESRNGG